MAKIFVGNLPYSSTEEDLREFFGDFDFAVGAIIVMIDRDTERSRGFAFVEVENNMLGRIIDACDNQILAGRVLTISEARPKPTGGRREDNGGRDRNDRARGARRG